MSGEGAALSHWVAGALRGHAEVFEEAATAWPSQCACRRGWDRTCGVLLVAGLVRPIGSRAAPTSRCVVVWSEVEWHGRMWPAAGIG